MNKDREAVREAAISQAKLGITRTPVGYLYVKDKDLQQMAEVVVDLFLAMPQIGVIASEQLASIKGSELPTVRQMYDGGWRKLAEEG